MNGRKIGKAAIQKASHDIDKIVRLWKQTANSEATISTLSRRYSKKYPWKNLGLYITSIHHAYDYRPVKNLIMLLTDLAIFEGTNYDSLMELVKTHSPNTSANLLSQISRHYDWSNRDRFFVLFKELLNRPEAKKEDFIELLTHSYSYTDETDGKPRLTNLLLDLISSKDSNNVIHFFQLASKLCEKFDMSDADICKLIDVHGNAHTVGTLIARNCSDPLATLWFTSFLGNFKQTDFIPYMPTHYNSDFAMYPTKEYLVQALKKMPAQEQEVYCKHALNPNHPLGYIMHMKRGSRECRPGKGQLAKVQEILDSTNQPAPPSSSGMFAASPAIEVASDKDKEEQQRIECR